MKTKLKKAVKQIINLAIVVVFAYLIYTNIDDFKTLGATITGANLIYLLNTLLLGIGNLVIFSLIFQQSFKLISEKTQYPKFLSQSIIYYFLSISHPLGYTGSTSFLLKYVVKNGLSHIKAVYGILITNLAFNLSYLAILLVTIMTLQRSGGLGDYQRYAAYIIVGIVIVLILGIIFLTIIPKFSASVAHFVVRLINRFGKPILKKELLSHNTIEEYVEEARTLSWRFDKSMKEFTKITLVAFCYHLIHIFALFLSFYAFDIYVPILKIITLYGIINLFAVVSPTPQGIGVVEGLAQSSAISIGLPGSVSLVAILTYRIAVLWAPALLGLILFRRATRDEDLNEQS